jgi:hypothetical protein
MNTSILYPIHQQVWAAQTLEEGKAIILKALDEAPVQNPDIKRMRVAVNHQITSKTKLDFFISNMLLAKDGLQRIK